MPEHSISSPFVFDNLHTQFGLATEPTLSIQEQQTLLKAAIQHNHAVVASILPPTAQTKPTVTITHDVDWLDPYHPYAWAQSFRGKLSGKPHLGFKQLWKRDTWLRNCEQLLQVEQQNNIQSIWCLGALPTEGMSRYDIRYSAHNPLLKELVSLIQQYKQEIGLHSSYHALSNSTFVAEVERLQQLTQQPIRFHRSHYLNASPTELYTQLEATGIQFDLGWGYPREVALKQGLPGMFKPANQNNLHTVQVVPLVMMDNVLFVKPECEVLNQFTFILQSVSIFKGTVCVLFHPENFLLKPDLWDSFQQIIHICKQQNTALQIPKT